MAPFNLFDCERSTNVRVNVVYFTEYLTLLCLIKKHSDTVHEFKTCNFSVCERSTRVHQAFGVLGILLSPSDRGRTKHLSFFLYCKSLVPSRRLSLLLFSSSCGSALQGAAAGGGGGAETALAEATPPQLLATGSRRAALVAAVGAP
jgi:hypothetical protein